MVSSHYIIVLRHSAFHEPPGSGLILACVMDRLREERERQGLTLKRLGLISGISRIMIAMAEKGERSPSLIICLRLADALGLNLDDVLKEVRKKRRRK